MSSIAQNERKVKPNSILTTEALALADVVLSEARAHRIRWLTTSDPLAWRLWQACVRDRERLLAEVGHVT